MIGELFYTVDVTVVPGLGQEEGGGGGGRGGRPTKVCYCDICRRWGAADTTHICWRNWRPRLSDLLMDLTRDGR